jgi:uncharacterized membrane protein (UPF0136 family)
MFELKAKYRGWIKSAACDLEPLWASGLALLCILLGNLLWGRGLHLEGESFEWAIYLTLGTIFPALLLFLTLRKRFFPAQSSPAQTSVLALGLLLLAASVVFILRQHQYTAFALSIVHLLLITLSLKGARPRIKPVSMLIGFLVVVIAWTVSARLLWWSSFGAWFFDTDSRAEVVYRFLVCLLSLFLIYVNLDEKNRWVASGRFRFQRVATAAAVLIIAVASVRSDQLFNAMSYSHWGVVVGPAEMVRQGGWLFWDVPSQYGFLNILLVAILPVKSVWQSTYIINSLLLFLSALFLFFLLRSVRPGLINFCFALLVTLSAVFLIAGWPPALLGPQVFPSLGPFRFIPCYALLLVLLWDFKRSAEGLNWRIPLVGCFVWLVGTLWSSESAVYCAAIWLPSYALIIYRNVGGARKEKKPGKSLARTILFWAMLPPVILGAAVGLIAIYYSIGLGHAPDWHGFYEYSFAFTGGFLSIPMDMSGPVWVIFLVFAALSTVAAYFMRDGLRHRAMSLIAGTWGALWAVSSYFVSRSHPNNATVLSPMLCMAIGVILYLLAAHKLTDWWARLVKMSLVPVLTMLLTVTFGNTSFLRLYLASPKIGYERDINSHLPQLDPSLLELLKTAEVKPGDALVYSAIRFKAVEPAADGLKHDGGVMPPAWPLDDGEHFASYKTWLPTMPFVLFDPLPPARKQIYMARFSARRRAGGWLIQNKREAPYTASTWFYNQLIKTHAPARMFENNDWQLIWFEYKPAEDER